MKLRFSLWWVVFLIFACFANAFLVFIWVMGMLLIHELMHVLMAWFLGYEVERIMIYPFGVGAYIAHLDHGRSVDEICIILAGLSAHLWFPFIFQVAYRMDWISSSFMLYLKQMNLSILLFNCLPIYPLDGGRIVDALLHLFCSYRLGKVLSLGFSLLVLCLLYLFAPTVNLSFRLVLSFLLIQLGISILMFRIDLLQFRYYCLKRDEIKRYRFPKSFKLFRNAMGLYRTSYGVFNEKYWLKDEYFATQMKKNSELHRMFML